MFLNKALKKNKYVRKAWFAAFSIETTGNVSVTKICKLIKTLESLKHASLTRINLMTNGAAKLYKTQIDALLKDCAELEFGIIGSNARETSNSEDDSNDFIASSSESSLVASPEQIRRSEHSSDNEDICTQEKSTLEQENGASSRNKRRFEYEKPSNTLVEPPKRRKTNSYVESTAQKTLKSSDAQTSEQPITHLSDFRRLLKAISSSTNSSLLKRYSSQSKEQSFCSKTRLSSSSLDFDYLRPPPGSSEDESDNFTWRSRETYKSSIYTKVNEHCDYSLSTIMEESNNSEVVQENIDLNEAKAGSADLIDLRDTTTDSSISSSTFSKSTEILSNDASNNKDTSISSRSSREIINTRRYVRSKSKRTRSRAGQPNDKMFKRRKDHSSEETCAQKQLGSNQGNDSHSRYKRKRPECDKSPNTTVETPKGHKIQSETSKLSDTQSSKEKYSSSSSSRDPPEVRGSKTSNCHSESVSSNSKEKPLSTEINSLSSSPDFKHSRPSQESSEDDEYLSETYTYKPYVFLDHLSTVTEESINSQRTDRLTSEASSESNTKLTSSESIIMPCSAATRLVKSQSTK